MLKQQRLQEKLLALDAAINLRQEAPDKRWKIALNDSMIVQYCAGFKLFWVFLIDELLRRSMPSGTPAEIIESLTELQLISLQEGALLLRMVEDGNFSARGYSPEEGKAVTDNIPRYFDLMRSLMTRLQEQS